MTDPIEISGSAHPPFADVRDVFARLIARQGRGGAALAVYHHGRPVVDLVGGTYRSDTVQLIFSISKAVTSIAAAILESSGRLDLDRPLASFWPAFDRASTRAITIRSVLSHRSGLAAVDQRLSLDDLVAGRDVAAIEVQEPYWEPNTMHGYHAFTFGTLLQGVFRRLVGTDVGSVVAEQISGPLGLDLWIGLPADVRPRVAPVRYDPPRVMAQSAPPAEGVPIPRGTTGQLAQEMDIYNSPELLRLGVPSSSGVAGARDLARLFAATLGDVAGIRLLSASARDRLIEPLADGPDRVLGFVTAFGSGVQRPFPMFPMLSASSYGHEAAGGSAAFADVEADLAVGFTTDVYPATAGASDGIQALIPVLHHCLRGSSRS